MISPEEIREAEEELEEKDGVYNKEMDKICGAVVRQYLQMAADDATPRQM